MTDEHPPTGTQRRAVAKGIAWSVPVLVVGAPAAHAACSAAPWDARVYIETYCGSDQCTVNMRICGSGLCTASVPIGTRYTITLRNDSPTPDSINKSSGSGYRYVQVSSSGSHTPPRDGQTATIDNGEIFTYVMETTTILSGTSCTQFDLYNINWGKAYTYTISLAGPDGQASNNTCTATTPNTRNSGATTYCA